jgi:hypothetical protein
MHHPNMWMWMLVSAVGKRYCHHPCGSVNSTRAPTPELGHHTSRLMIT